MTKCGRHLLYNVGPQVYFEGEVYAVKRTAFRWREVLIMPKLRHKNILRLIAMLMGPAMEGYPRRRYVFHYYPKMTSEFYSYSAKYGQAVLGYAIDHPCGEKVVWLSGITPPFLLDVCRT